MTVIPSSSSWFLHQKLHPQPRLRLFCFPYAGGTASAFLNWSSYLPPGVEVWQVQLPGRQNRFSEPPATQISTLVQAMTPALQEYLDIPFAFFGYCMGAHLSFELARQLRQQSSPLPEHLFIAARRAPQLPDPNPHCYRLSEPLFLRAVSNLNGLPAEFLENRELVHMMMPTLRADFEVAETYSYTDEEPFDCPITVFGGTEDYYLTSVNLLEGTLKLTGTFAFSSFQAKVFFT